MRKRKGAKASPSPKSAKKQGVVRTLIDVCTRIRLTLGRCGQSRRDSGDGGILKFVVAALFLTSVVFVYKVRSYAIALISFQLMETLYAPYMRAEL